MPPGDVTDEPGPPVSKVEITVAGHTVAVESAAPLAEVADLALGIFDQTARYARRSPVGFDATGGSTERAEPYVEPGTAPPYEEDRHAGRLGRLGS